MPLPTTRRGRFIYRQRRYQRRKRRQKNNGWVWVFDGERHQKTVQVSFPNIGPLMLAGPKNPLRVFWVYPEPRYFPITDLVVIRGGNRRFPVARIGHNPGGASAVLSYHRSHPRHGYHVRRVTTCRRKPNQLSAMARRVWGANAFYIWWGYFPPEDPLSRRPQWEDIAPDFSNLYAEGPFPEIRPTEF